MARLAIVGRRGSKSKLAISKGAGIPLYKGNACDAIINYGLAGQKLDQFLRKFRSSDRPGIINKYVGRAKHLAIQDAASAGILVPKTKTSLTKSDRVSDYIEKRIHSSCGRGIQAARGKGRLIGKYYQEMIDDRRFELRVHAFSWIPQEQWRINKRHGPANQIAWNFAQGGHFSNVRSPNGYKVFREAKEIAAKILEIRSMEFGGVDLIVDNKMRVYFIEVNASPGFEDLNRQIYIDAFSKLKDMSAAQVRRLARK
jgi:hypothetical protein